MMTKSKWKLSFTNNSLLKKKSLKNKKIWNANSTINQSMIGSKILVYNGKIFVPLYIKSRMLGYKIGEFIYTKKMSFKIHSKKSTGKHTNKNNNKKK